jgi:hypothetical protein
MDKRTLARLIIKSYDFKEKRQFERVINFLKTVLFHVEHDTDDIQYTIWYLEDKERLCK